MGDARLGHGVSFVRSEFGSRIGARPRLRDEDRHVLARMLKIGSNGLPCVQFASLGIAQPRAGRISRPPTLVAAA
jgi:hypothetical protein